MAPTPALIASCVVQTHDAHLCVFTYVGGPVAEWTPNTSSDVQIAARRAGRRTTLRYDRARKNLDRHPDYILAAYMAPAT